MRRMTPEEWSGLVMLAVCAGVGLPVLLGAAETQLPRPLWAVLFVAVFLAILGAAGNWSGGSEPTRVLRMRQACYAVTVVLSWILVLTAQLGLLPVLLVVVAALGPGVIPLRATVVVIVANTVVAAAAQARSSDDWSGPAIVAVFYLLIQIASVFSVMAIQREQGMRRELGQAHVELQAASVLLGESARSAERLRIARELHDLIGHQLTLLTLELEAARHREGAAARDHVERADQVARAMLSDVRSTVSELRARPAGSLAESLREVGHAVPGLEVSVEVAEDVILDEEQTLALVRAVQEIVTNALRHAQARELWVRVSREADRVRLSAGDDGRGAAEVVPGNGLRGLAERFAQLGGGAEFSGRRGFEVAAWLPAR